MYTSPRVQEINQRLGLEPRTPERQASWEKLFGNGRKTLIITLTPQPRNPSQPRPVPESSTGNEPENPKAKRGAT